MRELKKWLRVVKKYKIRGHIVARDLEGVPRTLINCGQLRLIELLEMSSEDRDGKMQ